MIKRALLVVGGGVVVLVGLVAVLYAANGAPDVPEISAVEAATSSKPYVVKLHARWCPICMLTTGVWSEIEETYADRVQLLVLDFTNEETTAASEAEARRLGLDWFFEEYSFATGLVTVVDPRTKQVTAEIGGVSGFNVYRDAIDAALGRTEAAATNR